MLENIVKTVKETRIIAIMRGFSADTCLRLAESYAKGGIRLVEVTFVQKARETWSDTVRAIRSIKERFGGDMHVGAGTVLSEEQLGMCQDAGGEYMIAPGVDAALVKSCVERGMAAIPGAMSPTEAVVAWQAGASFVKIFPAGPLGPGFVKAIRAPLSHIPFLAVGGVTPGNIADFMRAGCVGAGVGGNLSNREWIAAGEWEKIEDTARRLVAEARLVDQEP
jgi:2-dehydro-3-deoxyphosphogluconate aldolase/(4S)-4-hydroxy-2-oxoglutarate aldolase